MHGKLLKTLLFTICFWLVASVTQVSAQSTDPYLWEAFTPRNVTGATTLISELQKEVAVILSKGPLAPLRTNYADLAEEAHWQYTERGRIITTLAYSYPYLTTSQQEQVKNYVKQHLASGAEAVWRSTFKAINEGEERRLHGVKLSEGASRNSTAKPTLHVIYGLWLYAYRSGDWATVQGYWSNIKQYYQNNKSTHIFYGQMSGHLAMARLAQKFGDSATQSTATSDFAAQLSAGMTPSTIESRVKASWFNRFYSERNASYFTGQPWQYMELSPEIARYINSNSQIKSDYTNRITQFAERYRDWWLHQLTVFNRWTGDEATGIPSDIMNIMFPYERWVKNTPAATLANYLRSIPTGIGDSYWLESLVMGIEAHGQPCWQDVRSTTTNCSPNIPPSCPTDINQDQITDLDDYTILVANFFASTMTNPRADINQDLVVDLTDYSLLTAKFLQACN